MVLLKLVSLTASLGIDLFIQETMVKCPLQDIPGAEDRAINKTAKAPTSIELTF